MLIRSSSVIKSDQQPARCRARFQITMRLGSFVQLIDVFDPKFESARLNCVEHVHCALQKFITTEGVVQLWLALPCLRVP
jgi:hypothetical protein